MKKGSKHSSQSLKKLYASMDLVRKELSDKKVGKNNPQWKGGITAQPDYKKKYRRKHKARIYFHTQQRRAMQKSVGGSHTLGEWEDLKAQYNWTCPSCRKSEPEIKLTEDHIIPLSKGGSCNIENIQPLCHSCNCKKHTKIIKFDIQI